MPASWLKPFIAFKLTSFKCGRANLRARLEIGVSSTVRLLHPSMPPFLLGDGVGGLLIGRTFHHRSIQLNAGDRLREGREGDVYAIGYNVKTRFLCLTMQDYAMQPTRNSSGTSGQRTTFSFLPFLPFPRSSKATPKGFPARTNVPIMRSNGNQCHIHIYHMQTPPHTQCRSKSTYPT